VSGITFHKHRIVPGHMGGTYDAHNVVRVNVAMHAFLHMVLWEEHGRWQDRIAWQVLSGMIGKEQGRIQAVGESSKHRWANNAEYRAKVIASHSNPQTQAKRSAQATKLWSNQAFRSRMIAAQVKRWADPERRERQAARQRGKTPAKGYKHTEEAKAKISAAQAKRKISKVTH